MNLEPILSFCSGIVIITLAIKMVSESFQYIARPLIQRAVGLIKLNQFYNFLLGGTISSFVQSGFSTTVMFMSYLNSGLMNRRQLIFLSLGSGIGILWIFLFLGLTDYAYESLDYTLIVLGFVPMAYGRNKYIEATGRLCFAVGFLMLGYRLTLQLNQLSPTLMLFKPYFSLSVTMGVAYLLFFLIRSEIALLVINLVAFIMGVFGIPELIMFSFGVFIAESMIFFKFSLVSNTVARQLSTFKIAINFINLMVFYLFLSQIHKFLLNQYLVFKSYGSNIFSAVLLIILIYVIIIFSKSILTIAFEKPLLAVIEKYIFRAKIKEPQKLIFIGSAYQMSPVLAIEHVLKEDMKMAATLQTLLSMTRSYLEEEEEELIQKIKKYERILDNVQQEVFDYLSRVMVGHLNLDQGKQVRALARIADELESASDCCKAIGLSVNEINKMGVQIDGGIKEQMIKLFDQFLLYYESFFALFTDSSGDIKELRKFSDEFEENLVFLKKDYLAWLKLESGSDYNLEASVKVEDIIRALKQLKGHCQNILEAYQNSF